MARVGWCWYLRRWLLQGAPPVIRRGCVQRSGSRDTANPVRGTVDSADIGAANHDGLVAMRTAVHAAGVGTPGWTIDMSEVAAHEDEFAEQLRWVEVGVRGVDLVDV